MHAWCGALLTVLAGATYIASVRAATAPSAVRGVHLLPAGDRVSVVIEFDRKVGATKVDATGNSDSDTFLVDIGPLPTAAVTAVLRPSTSRLVREVRIDPLTNAAHQSMIRVHVKLQKSAAGSVRVAEQRVYLDFSPVPDQSPIATIAASTRPPAPVPAPDERDTPAALPRAPASSDVPTSILDRAKLLAKRPDVKGLVDLRAKAAQLVDSSKATDEQAERLQQELAQIDAYLIEAQRLQLARDAQLFRTRQLEDYLGVLRRAASDVDQIGARLQSTTLTPGELSDLRVKSVQLASRLRAATAPSQFGSQHTALCAAADEAVAALAGASTNDPATVTSTVFPAVEHTRSALKAVIAAASDPPIN